MFLVFSDMTDDGSISMKLYRIMVGVELALSVCLVVTILSMFVIRGSTCLSRL